MKMNKVQKKIRSYRSLDRDVPELREYLHRGAKVLDVGCGISTITCDVAEAVWPGEVVGVDRIVEKIESAVERLEEPSYPKNVTYRVGDAHVLDFPDDTFDVVYSHTVVHFLLDPVTALKEQRRVTKKGGWVIASGVRDYRLVRRYPACPAWEKVWEAITTYYGSRLEEFLSSGKSAPEYTQYLNDKNPSELVYFNMHSGTKCPDWFVKAGLKDLDVRVKLGAAHFAGVERKEPSFLDLLRPRKIDENTPVWQQRSLDFEQMISQGLLDEEMVVQAEEEALSWYANPDAFYFYPLIWVAGRS